MTGTALAATFVASRPALLRYLRARGAGDEAEDLLHELWIKLGTLDCFRPENPSGYLYRMAHNLMLDRVREARRRRDREHVFQDLQRSGHGAGNAAVAEQALIARQRLVVIDRVLDRLGPRTDLIFRRYRIEGWSQQEIARALGVSLSAVEKHLQKAYRAIAAAQRDFAGEDCAGEPNNAVV